MVRKELNCTQPNPPRAAFTASHERRRNPSQPLQRHETACPVLHLSFKYLDVHNTGIVGIFTILPSKEILHFDERHIRASLIGSTKEYATN